MKFPEMQRPPLQCTQAAGPSETSCCLVSGASVSAAWSVFAMKIIRKASPGPHFRDPFLGTFSVKHDIVSLLVRESCFLWCSCFEGVPDPLALAQSKRRFLFNDIAASQIHCVCISDKFGNELPSNSNSTSSLNTRKTNDFFFLAPVPLWTTYGASFRACGMFLDK